MYSRRPKLAVTNYFGTNFRKVEKYRKKWVSTCRAQFQRKIAKKGM